MRFANIKGQAYLLGDDVNTDLNCSSRYLPGKDDATIAQHAFERVAPGFAVRFKPGGVIVAGRNFGFNSTREQAVRIMRAMGVAATVAQSFGRQFYRNAINNGLTVIECDSAGIADGDEIEIDLAAGVLTLAARGLSRKFVPLAPTVLEIVATGGLIEFVRHHPDWRSA